jgi:hypothetical protein
MAKPSMRKAIDAFCKDCIYDPLSGGGTWREQVGACKDDLCPLHELRPLPMGSYHKWQLEAKKKAADRKNKAQER